MHSLTDATEKLKIIISYLQVVDSDLKCHHHHACPSCVLHLFELPELCAMVQQDPRRPAQPQPGRLGDGGEARDCGLACEEAGRGVGELEAEHRP